MEGILKSVERDAMMPSTTLIDTIDDHINSIRVRIVTVGDVGVGKSCLIKKYCEPDKFVKAHTPTIGVDYGVKSASVQRKDKVVDVRIDFFDLSGNAFFLFLSTPPKM